jgi:hypothetical protein
MTKIKFFWQMRKQKERIALKKMNKRKDLKKPKEFFALIQPTSTGWGLSCGNDRVTLVSVAKYLLDTQPDHISRFFAKSVEELPILNEWGRPEFYKGKKIGIFLELIEIAWERNDLRNYYANSSNLRFWIKKDRILQNGSLSHYWSDAREEDIASNIKVLSSKIERDLANGFAWQIMRKSDITPKVLDLMIKSKNF